MKKLTIEQKAKAYDGLIERLKDLKFSCRFSPLSDTIDEIFPELKESEDERIRKLLIEAVIQVLQDQYCSNRGVSKEKVIAWLEKQDEQKPADKVEPKFKVGQWITNGDYTWKILEATPLDYILQSQDGKTVDDTVSHVDEQFHSFTIKDAKEGDVLAVEAIENYQYPFIVIYKENYLDFFNSYCFISFDGKFYEAEVGHSIEKIHPATKEQRDTLFAKMHEAGYEFDFEKKELKKIEDEPENYKQQVMSEITDLAKDYIRQKSTEEWSVEDSIKLQRIIDFLWYNRKGDTDTIYQQEQDIEWLKSLKERIKGE